MIESVLSVLNIAKTMSTSYYVILFLIFFKRWLSSYLLKVPELSLSCFLKIYSTSYLLSLTIYLSYSIIFLASFIIQLELYFKVDSFPWKVLKNSSNDTFLSPLSSIYLKILSISGAFNPGKIFKTSPVNSSKLSKSLLDESYYWNTFNKLI